MRRVAPWLPFAFAMLVLLGVSYRGIATDVETPWLKVVLIVAVSYAVLLPYSFLYVIPMLLVEWVRTVRRRTPAPPYVGWGAVALALPALVVGVRWPLGTAAILLWSEEDRGRLACALLLDHRFAAGVIWGVSVAATLLWVLGATFRWIWRDAPVVVEGAPPYR